jgi:signal transduction protein with GAF and PtsI domain
MPSRWDGREPVERGVDMFNAAAGEILVAGARALAHADGLGPSLQILIGSIAEQLEVESAAIFVVNERLHDLELAASIGLGDAAVAGLAAAVGNPGHPIARTVAAPVPSFDVLPTAPGGPALRSHLPLIVTRDGSDIVLGVLALAHDRPIDPGMRPLLLAGADLAAVAIERGRAD